MSKPTPRPWKVKSNDKFMDFFADGQRIFRTAFDEGAVHCSKANANYIVKCVNMHDELVTALSGAIVALRLGRHVDMQAAIDYGMEVLAKAQGGSNE